MTYDCMTPDELALWRDTQVARARAEAPCTDCPAWFAADAKARGCCRVESRIGRPVRDPDDPIRRQWREASRRYRASRGA